MTTAARSEESRSRENSTRHGLTGDGVVMPPSLRTRVVHRQTEYTNTFGPQDQIERDLVDIAALGFARFEEAQALQISRGEMRSAQAVSFWPLLRTLDTLERAKRLPSAPDRVVADLKLSLGGVEWMLQEWGLLRLALEKFGDWSIPQQNQAENLAGVRKIHRQLDPEKVRGGSLEDRKALADRQINALQTLLESDELAQQDARVRQEIIDGKGLPHDPGHERLARYEQRALRMYEKAIKELRERLVERQETDSEKTDPPFSSEFSEDEYLDLVSDPDSIKKSSVEEVKALPQSFHDRMGCWLGENGLDVDVIDALRGVLGGLRGLGIPAPTIQADSQSAPILVDTTAVTVPDQPDRDRKASRRDRRRAGKRRR